MSAFKGAFEALRNAVGDVDADRILTAVEAEACAEKAVEIDRLRKELDAVQRRYTDDTAELKRTVEYFDGQSKRRKAERDRYRSAWQSARERAQAYSEGILRITRDRESYQGWLKQEQAATQHLRAELAKRPEETYPGELAHLRGLLQDVGRLADKQPEGNAVTELLIDHYSDSRMVDATLANRGDR